MAEKVRIDKFLWSVRLFKKRTDATSACSKNAILVNEMPVKASRKISIGDKISVKNHVIFKVYKVIGLLEKRVGAKLVEKYITEITPEDDLFKLKMHQEFQKVAPKRDKPGRPTKKDRRELDDFFDNF